MHIGIGILAFVIYLAVVMLWYLALKRSIAESMLVGLFVACAFNGINRIPATLVASFADAMQQNVMAAIILFSVMAAILSRTGIMAKLINILNSVLGRVRGGAAYVSACASYLFGMVASASSANAATVGSITIPWMIESGWPNDVAAVMNAGNAGLGICGPVPASLFMMLGFAPIAKVLTYGDVYLALVIGAAWTLLCRLLVTRYYVWKYKIPSMANKVDKLGIAMKKGGTSLLMFLGIVIPLMLTIGPISSVLKNQASFGKNAVKAIDIIIWVPVLIMLICIILGHKMLPKTWKGWSEILSSIAKTCSSSGTVALFAFAGSYALTEIGFGEDLSSLLSSVNLPKFPMVLLVGGIIALVAGPLNASATTISLGLVAWSAMVAVGVTPVAALVSFLIFASTEGTSPPMSSPIFISSSIAGVENVSVMFKRLIFHYLVPIILVGVLVACGILPI